MKVGGIFARRISAKSNFKRQIVMNIINRLVGLFLVIIFVHSFSRYQVVGNGMQNTLNDGQDIFINGMAYLFHSPERGDVVALYDPINASHTWIKRIIGLPGDTVTLTSNGISINGVRLTEPYVTTEYNPVTETIKVPPDAYFVLGDNRRVSRDSRFFGFVPRKNIIGPIILGQTVVEICLGLCIGVLLCLFLVIRYKKAKKSRPTSITLEKEDLPLRAGQQR